MELRCPSKTFIVGEYAVLQGGAGIVLVHEPYFKADIHSAPPFHPHSPAGAYLQQAAISSIGEIRFADPYQGQGGFGASSAEFLFAYCYVNGLTLPLTEKHAWAAWQAYLATLARIQTTKASGVDVLAQAQAPGIYYIHPAAQKIIELPWPFPNYQLTVEHSGCKVPTHAHLASLPEIDATKLIELVELAHHAIINADLVSLGDTITAYQTALQRQNLLHPHMLQLQHSRDHDPDILAQKGCGALGVDVLLTLRSIPRIINLNNE